MQEEHYAVHEIMLRARLLVKDLPCDDKLDNELEVSGFGGTEKDAKDDLAAMQEAVAALLETTEGAKLKCSEKKCKGTCVFDWDTIGSPKSEEVPASKSKKHKIDLPKSFVARQKIRYGCLCDHGA
jgi:hypothetical protein